MEAMDAKDVGQKGSQEIGTEKLDNGEGGAAYQTGGPDLKSLLPSGHQDGEIEGNQDTEKGQGPTDHLADGHIRQPET